MPELRDVLRTQCQNGRADPVRSKLPFLRDFLHLSKWTTNQVGQALLSQDLYSAALISRSYLLIMFEGPIRWLLSAITGRNHTATLHDLEIGLEELAGPDRPDDFVEALYGRTLRNKLLAQHDELIEKLGSLTPRQQEAAEQIKRVAESMTELDVCALRNAIAHFNVVVLRDGTTVF